MGILSPALSKVRRQASHVLVAANQGQVVKGVLCYAVDNDDLFPLSVAVTGRLPRWEWSSPTTLTGVEKQTEEVIISMSAYLRSYIPNAGLMACRNAPREHEYLDEAWEAGEDWENPGFAGVALMMTTECFYWNYDGYLAPGKQFKGPSSASGRTGESKLLMSCYFGYDNYPNDDCFSSCEKFRDAGVTPEYPFSSATYWSAPSSGLDLSVFRIKLHAGYTDGHVSSYSTSQVTPMEVIYDRSTGAPWPPGHGNGVFFLPEEAVR